jgi:branched-chain amino acid transport system ATP-binding protein
MTERNRPILEVRAAGVSYGGILGIREFNLVVDEASFWAVLGPNGAGKSSALRAITGQGETTGTVIFDGRDISRWSPHRRARAGLIHVPQGGGILRRLTVDENLALGGYAKPRRARATALAKVFDLFPRLYERRKVSAGLLSGGEQQMLAMARVLMAEPRVLLLDEPTVGLAPRAVHEAFDRIATLRTLGIAVVMVDQNAPQAMKLADQVCVINRGKVVYQASADAAAEELDIVRAHLGLVTVEIDQELEARRVGA